MSKLKLVVALIIVGFVGLQFIVIAQAQDTPKDQMKKNQTNNNSKNQTNINALNKFEFQPLPNEMSPPLLSFRMSQYHLK